MDCVRTSSSVLYSSAAKVAAKEVLGMYLEVGFVLVASFVLL